MFVDTHCHLNSSEYSENLEEYIKKAQANKVELFIVIGWNLESSIKAVEIANKYECCYAAVGIHPENIFDDDSSALEKIEELIRNNKKIIAVGEIGLDYYWDKDEEHHKKQQEYFIKQIELANKCNLPIDIHARDALNDCYEILKEHPVNNNVIMHCFGGSKEQAREFIKLGCYLGIGGVVTFKNSRVMKEVTVDTDINKILLETDCPYLTPVPYRGTLNEPSYIPLIAQTIADLKNMNINDVEEITTKNMKEAFNLDE